LKLSRLIDRIHETTTFVTYSFLLRGFEALGAAAYSTASYTFVADVFPDHIGPVMGILETFVGLGMSAGPVIGGVLYAVIYSQILHEGEINQIWFIAVGRFWSSFLLSWNFDGFVCTCQHSPPTSRRWYAQLLFFFQLYKFEDNFFLSHLDVQRPKSGSILEVLRVPSVIVIGLVVIVSAANWGFLDPTLEPHLRQVSGTHTFFELNSLKIT
jgi:MFS family permease